MTSFRKSRPDIDLNEIERQLQQSGGDQAAPAKDPLAELARIVGQNDPFRALLDTPPGGPKPAKPAASDKPVPQPSAAPTPAPQPTPEGRPAPDFSFDLSDLTAARPGAGAGAKAGSGQPGSSALRSEPPLTREEDGILHGPGADRSHQAYEPDLDAGRYGGPDDREPGPDPMLDGYGSPESYLQEDDMRPLPPRRSRKGLVAMIAILVLAVAGVAGFMMYRSGRVRVAAGGEPPVIQADTAPLKVAPQNPGGLDIPNQDNPVFQREGSEGKTRVVDRQEQPLDVATAVRAANPSAGKPATLPGQPDLPPGVLASVAPSGISRPAPADAAGQENAGFALGEPRRVRTVTVRADGSLASDPVTPPPAAAPVSLPPAVAPQAPVAPEAAPSSARNATPQPRVAEPATPLDLAPTASAPTTATPSSQPAAATNVLPPHRPRRELLAGNTTPSATTATPAARAATAPAAATAPNAPLQITPQGARQPSRVAAAPQPTAIPEASEAPAGSGRYSVQLTVAGNEQEARAATQRLTSRYAGELGGRAIAPRRADVNGKSVYRLRVGPMSREEATSLCSRLKSSGGQCFVANN